ncbi:MAG: sigma-70 family RNA polymerase sigma factor [Ruminococcaceae bacterium]|nr:sigma-70 family RNA polymerase sigma factor [Oscillospiraceae bacterium]
MSSSVSYEQNKIADYCERNSAVEQNLGLVYMIVNRFKNRGFEMDDLQQIATLGLIKAIDNYNPDFGTKLSTYAVPFIVGEVKRYMRDNTLLKISRSYKILNSKADHAHSLLSEKLGREPSLSEIAELIGTTPEDLSIAISANKHPASLNETQGDSNLTLSDQLVDDKEALRVEDRLTLWQLIGSLPKREQSIIRWRYIEEHTQSAIAKRLGISQVQVSRLEKSILQKLRAQL